jgi:hypothetical protein
LVFKRCCGANSQQCANFSEVVHMFCDESFLEALDFHIDAFKEDQATAGATQLQAMTSVRLAQKVGRVAAVRG